MRTSWTSRFHPVARSADLVDGHIYHGRLLGQELAVWRDGEGRPNAWENRCPHRGMRLTVGMHLGSGVRCLYHGLRYASGSGRCTAIPSLGDRELPRQLNICVKTFAVREKYGLVWASLAESASEPVIAALDGVQHTTLRSVVIGVAAENVMDALANSQHHGTVVPAEAGTRRLSFASSTNDKTIILIVQPADLQKSIVHSVAIGEFASDDSTTRSHRRWLVSDHNARLCALRDALESTAIAPRATSSVLSSSAQARELLQTPT